MIIISKEGIQHQGTKHELVLDLVSLIYNFTDFVPLDEDEIIRLEKCFGPMLRQQDVLHLTETFNEEQKEETIQKLYTEVGIKRLEK